MAGNDAPGGAGGAAAGEVGAGSTLGSYRIEQLIGRGGMGVVYRAHDVVLDRRLALKLLAPELAEDPAFRERFLRESRLAASLDHPSIVPIFEAGEADGQLYIAMRLVEGTDLKTLLAAGPLASTRALQLLEQVADALDAAHESGLVHRDVKPSNVLIDARGHAYLADFGLSRRLAEQAPVAGGERSLGTVAYVAPEQIRGDELDGRADTYSLGCLLFECLAGRPPFAGVSDTAVVFAHLDQAPPSFPGLDSVIAKALAKSPGDRYSSCRDLIAAAREAMPARRLAPARRRAGLALAAVTLLGAGLAAVALHGGGHRVEAEPGADSLLHIDPVTTKVVSSRPVGREASGVAAAGRHVWVTSFADGTVWRIDRDGGAAVKIAVRGHPTGVAAGGGSVLVANGPEHTLAPVDPESGAVASVQPLAGDAIGKVAVAAGASGVWFADATEGIAARLVGLLRGGDAPADPIAIPADAAGLLTAYESFNGLAVGPGALWAVGDGFDRTLWKLDPSSGRVIASLALPFVPGSVAVGEGAVWVGSQLSDVILRIDPATSRIIHRIPVPRGVVGLAAGAGAVWVASSLARVVSRIDPHANRVVRSVPTVGTPTHIAVGAGAVWVTTARPTPRVPRGTIGIGLLADCTGPYGRWRDWSIAGAELVLLQHGGSRAGSAIAAGVDGARIAGRPVRLVFGCTDRSATSALGEARRLVDEAGVRIVIGPTYASEELALQEFARLRPGVAFVNGSAGAQLLDPPANTFSFTTDGAGYTAGLGSYAYRTLGWRTAVVVGDLADRAFNWAQTAGFIAEFCSLGGSVSKRIWVPAGTRDYADVIAQMPRGGADGVFAAAGAETIVALSRRYSALRGNLAGKLMVGTGADDSDDPGIKVLGKRMSGVLVSGPWHVQERAPAMGAYLAAMRRAFPRFKDPFGTGFDMPYHDAMAATALALTAVHGDLSGGERRFMGALARTRIASPTGPIRLDATREAIGTVYRVRRVDGAPRGRLNGVEHTFGGYFTPRDAPPSTSSPACHTRTPPAWAR